MSSSHLGDHVGFSGLAGVPPMLAGLPPPMPAMPLKKRGDKWASGAGDGQLLLGADTLGPLGAPGDGLAAAAAAAARGAAARSAAAAAAAALPPPQMSLPLLQPVQQMTLPATHAGTRADRAAYKAHTGVYDYDQVRPCAVGAQFAPPGA